MLRRLGSLLVELGVTDAQPVPTELRIFRAGKNTSEKGTFIFDEKSAKSVMASANKRFSSTAANSRPFPFDYNHGSTSAFGMLNPEMSGKAAGWCRLELRAGELWAVDIEWTEAAAKAIAAKEWKFISPTFLPDKDGRIAKMLCIALQNTPALHDLTPLVAASMLDEREDRMNPQMLTALGLKADASETEVLAAIIALNTGTQALSSEKVSLTARVTELSTKVATLEATAEKVELDALITKGLSERKITPATEKALRGIGVVALKAFIDAAPAVVDGKSAKEKDGGAADQKPAVELTANEKAHCKKFQIDPAKYLEHKVKLVVETEGA